MSLNWKSSLHECSTADRYGVKLFENDGPAPEMPAGARSRVLDTYQFLFAPKNSPRLQENTDFPPRCTSGRNYAIEKSPNDIFMQGTTSYECWAGKTSGAVVLQLHVDVPLSGPATTVSRLEPILWALVGAVCTLMSAFVIFLVTPWSAFPNGAHVQRSWMDRAMSVIMSPRQSSPAVSHQAEEAQGSMFDSPCVFSYQQSPANSKPVIRAADASPMMYLKSFSSASPVAETLGGSRIFLKHSSTWS